MSEKMWHKRFFSRRHKMREEDGNTACGIGSSVSNTEEVRAFIACTIAGLKVTSICDCPCGDFSWMRLVDLSGIAYTGWDIVSSLIAENKVRYPEHTFEAHDVVQDVPPKVDVILSRDFLIHLSNADAKRALNNFKASGSKYLLISTYPDVKDNGELNRKGPIPYRPYNLELAPFNLGPPVCYVKEKSNAACVGRIVALYRLNDEAKL